MEDEIALLDAIAPVEVEEEEDIAQGAFVLVAGKVVPAGGRWKPATLSFCLSSPFVLWMGIRVALVAVVGRRGTGGSMTRRREQIGCAKL